MARAVYDETNVKSDAQRYLTARPVLDNLRRYRGRLTSQQLKTLRGQALSGDVKGAEAGLCRILGITIAKE